MRITETERAEKHHRRPPERGEVGLNAPNMVWIGSDRKLTSSADEKFGHIGKADGALTNYGP